MEDLKICPNCGSSNLTRWEKPEIVIECNDCSEYRSEEEWQAGTAREKALQAKVDALVELHDKTDLCRHLVTQVLIGMSDALNKNGFSLEGADAHMDKATELMEEIPALRTKCQALGLAV